MRNRLDQLFKNKLSDHTLTPSVNAWDRVKEGLAKKNNRPILFRMAAAVLLAGALTTTLFWLSSEDHVPNLSSSSSQRKKPESITGAVKTANPPPQSISVENQKTAERPVSKKNRPVSKDIEKVHTVIEEQNKVSPSVIAEESLQASGPVAAFASQQIVEKPIVLVYQLEPIEPQRVVKSASVPEHKEKSGLLKAIDFARDAKNGDGGLGDLRQAKDELFAFNFKKDKQNNNK